MSFAPRHPPKNTGGQFFGPALVGACLAVVLSVPAAAFVAASIGDSYEMRALIYSIFLLWALIGAITIFAKTYRYETKRLTPSRILLWFVSTWVWPLLLIKRKS